MFFSIAGLVRSKPVASRVIAPKLAEPAVLSRRVKLPAPDRQNITVLSRKLPNQPILPWNHYDSPWLEAEPQAASKN